MTLNLGVIKLTMVMIPINHAAPLLLSPDMWGPYMTLNLGVIKLTMVMIPINHTTPSYCHLTMWGLALHDIKSLCD